MSSVDRHIGRNPKRRLSEHERSALNISALISLGLLIVVTAYSLLGLDGHIVDEPVPQKLQADTPD